MQVNGHGLVELSKAEPYKGLRPSANYLFQSLAQTYGNRAAGVILTGMGDDGANGLEALHAAGGLVFAQAEKGCVIFGMPREAIVRGAVDQILGLEHLSLALQQLTVRS
jgi:two-component system chemotaxis response regulator CheB